MQKGKRATLAEDVILKHISQLEGGSISVQELQKAKNLIQFNL